MGFCQRVNSRVVRFKKSTFWVHKVHILGVLHLPKIDPGYGPACLAVLSLFVCQQFANFAGDCSFILETRLFTPLESFVPLDSLPAKVENFKKLWVKLMNKVM